MELGIYDLIAKELWEKKKKEVFKKKATEEITKVRAKREEEKARAAATVYFKHQR